MADFPDSTPMTEISRPVVEAEIELLIGLLDQLDEDADLEDNADLEPSTGDEEPLHGAPEQQTGSWAGLDPAVPSCFEGEELELGWTELEARFGRYQAAGSDVYEPSLGSTGSVNQIHWSKGGTDDGEDEHDGREPDCDDEDGHDAEGELGWTDLQSRTGRYVLGPGWYVVDGEPSLASTNSLNQVHWWKGKTDDLEEQCDDEGEVHGDKEPDFDGEGTGNYMGGCSPVKTLIGGSHAK